MDETVVVLFFLTQVIFFLPSVNSLKISNPATPQVFFLISFFLYFAIHVYCAIFPQTGQLSLRTGHALPLACKSLSLDCLKHLPSRFTGSSVFLQVRSPRCSLKASRLMNKPCPSTVPASAFIWQQQLPVSHWGCDSAANIFWGSCLPSCCLKCDFTDSQIHECSTIFMLITLKLHLSGAAAESRMWKGCPTLRKQFHAINLKIFCFVIWGANI